MNIYSKSFSVFLCLIFADLAQSQDVGEVTTEKKIRCATTHYPPFAIFETPGHEVRGSDVTKLRKLAIDFNWNMKIDNVPWSRLKLMLGTSTYDCYFSLGDFPYRRELINYTDYPLHVSRYGLFYRKDFAPKNINNLGIVRGIRVPESMSLSMHLASANVSEFPSNEVLLGMLLKGRLDAFVTNSASGKYLLEQTGVENSVSVDTYDGYALPTFLVFSKHFSKEINLEEVNAWLKSNLN
ncbi:transporter substrate-binding domain-containing protein [Aliiglaciecola sp. LCG003]|uniref:substrate-binding periplasmic protein n=1 Tax=Aliiglaciecola sp. LCG003 TaxID=3053655 RepID=UPI0025726DA3|nr:transporter substrate-binding domain-containing protein [Aliiglaciecola sp. LCG003]WJG10761.1 transporter substrate-binding domain-containing protein [Aliiglaciecola sp. LCG003]